MTIAVKSPSRPFPKIIDTSGAEDENAEDRRLMVAFVRDNPAVEVFRVVKQGNGNYRLNKLKIKPGSEVTGTVIIDAEFEDVNPGGN